MEKETAFLFSGYIMSYLRNEDIIKWADQKILESVNNELIFDLSLSGKDETQLISILKKLCKESLIKEVDIYYFSLYRILLNKEIYDWNFIAKEMRRLYFNNFISINDNDFFFSRLYDYFELIRDGFTGNMDMPKELIEFLSNYNEDITIFKELDFNVRGVEISKI